MLRQLSDWLGGVPEEAVAALAALALVQVILQVGTLVDLARRGTVRGGRRWVWAAVILAGGVLGPVIWLAWGRRMPAGTGGEEPPPRGGQDVRSALDVLYGGKEEE